MIRQAKFEDLDFLTALAQNDYVGDGFNEELFTGVVNNLINNENAVVLVDEKMRGFIAGMVFPYFMDGELIGNEMALHVQKSVRKRLSKKLLQELELWAMSKGAARFTMKTELAKELGYKEKIEYMRML